MALLDAALAEQPPTGGALVISAIGGTGGIGKTWLALHWAHQHLDRFPDGQLYINLRGFDPTGQPLTPAIAVRGFLEALGVDPGAIPIELEAQLGLYRSLVAGKRMLILLDNARDTEQAASLLPGSPTCTVLVTSRRQLTGLVATHSACPVELDVLSPAESRELLVRQLGPARIEPEPDAAATLLRYCAGLPLALSIVAARAAAHPHLSLAALVAELRDHSHRLDALDAGEPQADLRAVLSWSSRALSPEAAAAFALLGIAPGPDIELTAAASLFALPIAKTRSLLGELQHAHLAQQHAAGRYRMHDLLSLHAAEQAHENHTPENRDAALRRLVDFYVHTAHVASRLLAPQHPASIPDEPPPGWTTLPLPDAAAAMAWFEAEHACVLAIQQLACTHGWDAQVYHLASALDPYLRRRGHIDDQVANWQLAVTSAKRLDNPSIRTLAHQMLGDAYAHRGSTADALDQLRQALALAEQTGDVAAQAGIHHSLGGSWERHGDDRRALDHAQQALSIFRVLGTDFQHARALNAVGWLQNRVGEYEQARANCEAALVLLRKPPSDGELGIAVTLDSLGYIARHLGEYDQALEYFGQALAICRARGHSLIEAVALDHIAETRLAQNDIAGARETWTRVLEFYNAQHRLKDAQRVAQSLAKLKR